MTSGFLEKLIERIGRIRPEEVQNYLLRLAREKGFLETIFNAIHEGVIVTDAHGNISFVNDAACELFGLNRDDCMGRALSERITRAGLALARALGDHHLARHGGLLSPKPLHQFLRRPHLARAARRGRGALEGIPPVPPRHPTTAPAW